MENTKEIGKGLYLLKKGQKGILRIIFSRVGLMIVMLLLQLAFLFGLFNWFNEVLPYFLGGNLAFSIWMVTYLLNSSMDPTAKITWLIIVMLVPVFGGLLLLFTQSEIGHRALKLRLNHIIDRTKNIIKQDEAVIARLKDEDPGIERMAKYMHRSGCFPVYKDTEIMYFPQGEDKWREMLLQLEKAKEFIFLEYFIIDEGRMWGSILEILAKKAKEGVEVRVMYDGTCEFTTLSHDYPKRLKELGIQCKMFAPVTPFLSTHYNYRDHRKILVIDGYIAFNGGVNLADEYINHIEKYGHWKDTAVMLKGRAVDSFTLMFLQMWNLTEKNEEYLRYMRGNKLESISNEGYVLPYGDSPLDADKVGERVYMDILNRAHDNVYIMSPYLILDSEMETAIRFAAERGVDVRLIMPGIPDKKAPYALAKTHYKALIESGVRIYEYTPGFVHAKMFVADNEEAVVGTINLDYRSLYHHFECATYMYKLEAIKDIYADFDKTFEKCRLITLQDVKRIRPSTKILGMISKAVAPLM